MNIFPIIPLKERLDAVKASRGMSRQDIADEILVSRKTLWDWQNGKPIHQVAHAVSLARILGCRPVDLIPELGHE